MQFVRALLHMSAKSSTFAVENIVIMSDTRDLAQKMTHTCYRCRMSEFASTSTRGVFLQCKAGKHVGADIHAETTCPRWTCSQAVQDVLDGTADPSNRRVVIEIMNNRVAAGTF